MGDDAVLVRLTTIEETLIERHWGPISTITWCSGDHAAAASFLKERLGRIVEKNPWLGGRVVTKNKDGSFLSYSKSESASTLVAPLFQHLKPEDSPIHRDVKLDQVGLICTKANLVLATYFDPKQELLKVSIVPCSKSPSTKFAILFSLCHIVADGHTFYRLYNMLMCDYEIEGLVVERIESTEKQQAETLGEEMVASTSGFLVCMLRGLFVGMCLGPFFAKYRSQFRYFLVDDEKMKVLKSAATKDQDVEFVSSNDVITSWYLSNCACGNGTMALNLRNRLDGHTDAHAGNYENVLYYRSPGDCQTPALIRESLQKLKGSPAPFPSTVEFGLQDVAIASNWVSFAAKEVSLPGCVEEAHIPIAASGLGVASLSLCTIFRYRPGQLAVGLFGTPKHLNGLVDAPFESAEPIG